MDIYYIFICRIYSAKGRVGYNIQSVNNLTQHISYFVLFQKKKKIQTNKQIPLRST